MVTLDVGVIADGVDGEEIEDPTWEAVEAAVRAMDNDTRTEVLLTQGEMDYLLVGGGAGRYVVSVQRPDEALTMRNPSAASRDDKVTLVSGGQAGEYEAAMVVSLDLVLQAAHAYLQSGREDPRLTWARD